mgnify:CR=1 FL=1
MGSLVYSPWAVYSSYPHLREVAVNRVLVSGLLSTALTVVAQPALGQDELTPPLPDVPEAPGKGLPPLPIVGICNGVGGSFGLLGMTVEGYLLEGHLSIFAGAGRWPEQDDGNPGTWAFAGGARGFFGGRRHRGYVQLSVELLEISWTPYAEELNVQRYYGPNLMAGYQLITYRGFTVHVGVGWGWSSGREGPVPGFDLGLGYTLRAWWRD